MEIIAIANQKGGVGKTTTTMNLGTALAQKGKRVLLVDLDPQHSLTRAMGIAEIEADSGTYALLRKTGNVNLLLGGDGKLGIIPASTQLTTVTGELNASPATGNRRLREVLKVYRNQFDIVLLDTPPNLDMLTVNALVAARWAIMPCLCQYMALEGLRLFLETFEQIKGNDDEPGINSYLEMLAVLPTVYKSTETHEREGLEALKQRFGELCQEPIPARTEYKNAALEHRPVTNGLFDYWLNLAKLVISKTEANS